MKSVGPVAVNPDDPEQQKLLSLIHQALELSSASNAHSASSHHQLMHSTLVDKFLLHSDFPGDNHFVLGLAMQLDPNLKILIIQNQDNTSSVTQYEPGLTIMKTLLGEAEIEKRIWFSNQKMVITPVVTSYTCQNSVSRLVSRDNQLSQNQTLQNNNVQSILDNNRANHPIIERWNGNQRPYFFVDSRYITHCITQQPMHVIHSLVRAHLFKPNLNPTIYQQLHQFIQRQQRDGLAYIPLSPEQVDSAPFLVLWWPYNYQKQHRNLRALRNLLRFLIDIGFKSLYLVGNPQYELSQVNDLKRQLKWINKRYPKIALVDLSNWHKSLDSKPDNFNFYALCSFLHKKYQALHIGLSCHELENLALTGCNVGYIDAAPIAPASEHPLAKLGYEKVAMDITATDFAFSEDNQHKLTHWLQQKLTHIKQTKKRDQTQQYK